MIWNLVFAGGLQEIQEEYDNEKTEKEVRKSKKEDGQTDRRNCKGRDSHRVQGKARKLLAKPFPVYWSSAYTTTEESSHERKTIARKTSSPSPHAPSDSDFCPLPLLCPHHPCWVSTPDASGSKSLSSAAKPFITRLRPTSLTCSSAAPLPTASAPLMQTSSLHNTRDQELNRGDRAFSTAAPRSSLSKHIWGCSDLNSIHTYPNISQDPAVQSWFFSWVLVGSLCFFFLFLKCALLKCLWDYK